MDTPRVAIRCSQCGRLLREVKEHNGQLFLMGRSATEGGGWAKDTDGSIENPNQRRSASCYDVSWPPREPGGEVTRYRFVCEHRNGRARSVPIGAQKLLARCAAALAGPGPAEVLI